MIQQKNWKEQKYISYTEICCRVDQSTEGNDDRLDGKISNQMTKPWKCTKKNNAVKAVTLYHP